jgi:hypothetical protein
MADWSLGPDGAEQAKVIANGGFGSLFALYLRRPKTILLSGAKFALGIASAVVFTPDAVTMFGLREPAAAALIGLTSSAIAQGVLLAIEKFDFAVFWKGSKE